ELNQVFQAETEKSIFLCTYEAKPGMEEVMAELKGRPVKRIHLAPFLLAAGYHARKDMAGPGKESWRSICEEAGYEVVCHLNGLGEYPKVRERILFHLGEIIRFKNTR
ncbi:MAG: sirohydrochlorin cobaltochelatase, partial [Blautia sp.]|nr:sirohydrochlorin cobaltochelatase [Blautia sp.]